VTYVVVPSKRFLKIVKKFERGGRKDLLEATEEAVHLLSIHDQRSLFVLGTRWHDHALTGNRKGIRELHLSLDDLLLYCVDGDTQKVELLDIVNHETLRRQ